MPRLPETDHDGIRPFAITGPDADGRFLHGTGDPRLNEAGQGRRQIFVEILDPCTGQTWFGATRSWARLGGIWHWTLDLSLAADTAGAAGGFGSVSGVFELVAYYEERDPRNGRTRTVQTGSFDLTIAGPEVAAPTSSIPELLARVRQLGQPAPQGTPAATPAAAFTALPPLINGLAGFHHKPTASDGVRLPRPAGVRLPEDRFIFLG